MRSRGPVLRCILPPSSIFLLGCALEASDRAWPPRNDEPGVRGTLHFSIHRAQDTSVPEPSFHVTEFTNGRAYDGAEDNDIRGYIDGNVKWGWNQVGQTHVRIGRRGRSPQYGEYELFRALLRWDDLELPSGAKLDAATITLVVESSEPEPRRLLLYEVMRDWNPGGGGELRDNVSPPKRGEVWWGDARYGELSWGLPGAGYASDVDAEADTGEMPLAEAVYDPAHDHIVFSSTDLTNYIGRRLNAGQPLRILMKLSDYQEDLPGTMMEIYSSDTGDSRNLSRRPTLRLSWSGGGEVWGTEQSVVLEHGRAYALGPRGIDRGSYVAATFRAQPSSLNPTIQIRGGIRGDTAAWSTLAVPTRVEWDWVQLRVLAARDPVEIGTQFVAEFRDTWVRTAAPRDQRIPWVFESPTGRRQTVYADYVGDYHWRVTFTPDELGPWTYSWSHNLWSETEPFQSTRGVFDVVAGGLNGVLLQLDALGRRLELGGAEASIADYIQLSRLERAAVRLMNPQGFRSHPGERVSIALNRVRAAMDQEIPDSVPLVAGRPAPWQATHR